MKDDYAPELPSPDNSHSCCWNDTKWMQHSLKEKKAWYVFCIEPIGNNDGLPFVTTGGFTEFNGKEYVYSDIDLGIFRRDDSGHFVNQYNSWEIRYYMLQPGLPKEVWNDYWPKIKERFYENN